MTASINACVGTFIEMQQTADSGLSTSQVENLNACLVDMNAAAMEFEDNIARANSAQQNLNNSINNGSNGMENFVKKVEGLAASYLGIQGIGNVLGTSDDLSQTTARLSMMNDGLQSTPELVNMVYEAAQDARGSFADMADVVARFGNNAGEAFSSSQEVVEFATLVQKQMKIAGAGTQEASNAMLQLSQALGSGVLRGDELNSIFEQAPNLIQNISKYIQGNEDLAKKMADAIGVSYEEMSTNAQGHIRDIASEGLISADIVKAAVFSASGDIDEQLKNMPITWGDIWQSMKNTALMQFQPVLNKINDMANSTSVQAAVNGIQGALSALSVVALNVVDFMMDGAGFIVDNWSMIEPVIVAVTIALVAYTAALTGHNTIQAVSNGLKTLGAIAAVAHGTATAEEAAATTGMTAAQVSFNATLLACPIAWIIAAIIALITIIYLVVAAVNNLTGTTYSATGIISGAFAVAGAFIMNSVIAPLWNAFATFSNFIANVFNDPVAAVVILFSDMALTVIGYITMIAAQIEALINKIPGMQVDFTSGLDNLYNNLASAQQEVKDESTWVEQVSKINEISYTDAWNAGYGFGESIDSKVSDLSEGFETNLPDSIADGLGDINDYSEATAGNTGAVADSLDVTEDNLAWLKDIAEREIIDRTVFRDIKVDMGGINNTVNNMNDLDGIGQYLADTISEQMAVSAEGVY
jgi:tape measure domain-containing protein